MRGRLALALSVDLIAGDEVRSVLPPGSDTVSDVVGLSEKLEGAIVRLIWHARPSLPLTWQPVPPSHGVVSTRNPCQG